MAWWGAAAREGEGEVGAMARTIAEGWGVGKLGVAADELGRLTDRGHGIPFPLATAQFRQMLRAGLQQHGIWGLSKVSPQFEGLHTAPEKAVFRWMPYEKWYRDHDGAYDKAASSVPDQ